VCTIVESIRTVAITQDKEFLEALKNIQDITKAMERLDREAEERK